MVNNTISNLFELYNIYEQTTIILGIASLIMGATLLTLSRSLLNSGLRSKSGLTVLAIALFVLGCANFIEYAFGDAGRNELYSLSIVVFVASMELFLLFTAYMSMLCKEFINKRRMCVEIGCIVLFATPAMLVSPVTHLLLFSILFGIGIVFYSMKFALNIIEYRKQMKFTKEKVESYHSYDSKQWLMWINRTFYLVFAIGIIAIVIPMTNITILTCYNIFVFFAYFCIYISVIRNISIFDKGMSELENEQTNDIDEHDARLHSVVSFMSDRRKFLDDWISERGYAVAGVTATEVAMRLKTNRSKLSQYLNNELHTTYYEWIAELRIEDAKSQLIQYPDRAIYEIALNVGIEDRDNFRRVFQRYVGVSPTAYRKEHVNANNKD